MSLWVFYDYFENNKNDVFRYFVRFEIRVTD